MWQGAKQGVFIIVLSTIAVLSVSTNADAQGMSCAKLPGESCHSGTLNDGATYLIEVPALGPKFNIFEANGPIVPTAPAFIDFLSGPYPRPFDSLAVLCPKGANRGCPFAFFLQH